MIDALTLGVVLFLPLVWLPWYAERKARISAQSYAEKTRAEAESLRYRLRAYEIDSGR